MSASSGASDLTVVICTHNRQELLGRTLASLNAARRPEGRRVDLLIIPNACSDGTHAMLRDYCERAARESLLPLTFSPEPRPGKSHALNHAIRLMKAPLIAFTDDDQRVEAGYLVGILDAADQQPEFELFCGRLLPDWDGTEPAFVHDTGPFRIYPLPVPRYDPTHGAQPLHTGLSLPSGGNIFFRRTLLDRVGGFSAEFGPRGHNLGGAEDMEWLERALAAQARIFFTPDVVQFHYVDTARLTLFYLMHKAYERSSSVIRLSKFLESKQRVPLYMFRKVFNYLLQAVGARSTAQRRFYLIRLAAALGEIDGARFRVLK